MFIEDLKGTHRARLGAIDCGTNSIRLLIADSTTDVVDGVEEDRPEGCCA